MSLSSNTSSSPSFADILPETDLVCFSSLRWEEESESVRTICTEIAASHQVIYFEPPLCYREPAFHLDVSRRPGGVWVAVPHLQDGLEEDELEMAREALLCGLLRECSIRNATVWNRSGEEISRERFATTAESISTTFHSAIHTERTKRNPLRRATT